MLSPFQNEVKSYRISSVILPKFHRTDLVICSYFREGESPSYSQINTVNDKLYFYRSKLFPLKVDPYAEKNKMEELLPLNLHLFALI